MMSEAFASRRLALLLGASICIGLVSPLAYASGVPEPGITLYGQVLADDGSLVTQGRLTWTFIRYGDPPSPRVTVAADLFPLPDGLGTTYSYCVHIPAEMPVDGMPISNNCLPATPMPVVYQREATLDGALISIAYDWATTTTFAQAERGRAERVDLVTAITRPPAPPSFPSPFDGELLVPITTNLDWADSARAETYDLFIWQVGYIRPSTPTATGLSASLFPPPVPLRPDTDYQWQVIAHNSNGSSAGPIWTFRTAFEGDLQKLLEYLLGKRSLTYEEQAQLDLNRDGNLDVADFILGLKRSGYRIVLPEGTPGGEPQVLTVTGDDTKLATWSLGGRLLALGSAFVHYDTAVAAMLEVNIHASAEGVAGINLHIETDPTVIQFVSVTPQYPNAAEDLYYHSPYPGVLNVVFFANPVNPLSATGPRLLRLDLLVTPIPSWTYSPVNLTVAAVSDVNGASCPDVGRRDGYVRLIPTTPAQNWELYR